MILSLLAKVSLLNDTSCKGRSVEPLQHTPPPPPLCPLPLCPLRHNTGTRTRTHTTQERRFFATEWSRSHTHPHTRNTLTAEGDIVCLAFRQQGDGFGPQTVKHSSGLLAKSSKVPRRPGRGAPPPPPTPPPTPTPLPPRHARVGVETKSALLPVARWPVSVDYF